MDQRIYVAIATNSVVDWFCSFVHASTDICSLWNRFANVEANLSAPWLLIGDLNVFAFDWEK